MFKYTMTLFIYSQVKDSLSTFRDNAGDMSTAQKTQVRRLMKDSIGSAGNWGRDDIVK